MIINSYFWWALEELSRNFSSIFVVQSPTCVQLFCNPMNCRTPGLPVLHQLWSLPMMPLNHLILYHPLLFLPSIFPSIRVFSKESDVCIRWPKYWNFNFSPSNEYSELISFRIDLFDLLVVQGTLKSLLQHNSKASILWHSSFFMVQLSHLYMTTGKT